jgi:hypothetical protein
MSEPYAIRFGKTKVDIRTRGCVYCGTEVSHYWQVVRTFKLTIETGKWKALRGNPRTVTRELTVSACGHCCGIPETALKARGKK